MEEKNLAVILKSLNPRLNAGDYVFCTVKDFRKIESVECLMIFKEAEGTTVIAKKEIADEMGLQYTYVARWITLTVHSSLAAVGLTAAFSTALAKENISCNVVAGYFHDHIFVDRKDASRAMQVLSDISQNGLNEQV